MKRLAILLVLPLLTGCVGWGPCGSEQFVGPLHNTIGCGGCDDGHCHNCDGYNPPFGSVRKTLACGSGCGEVYYGEWLSNPPNTCNDCDARGFAYGTNPRIPWLWQPFRVFGYKYGHSGGYGNPNWRAWWGTQGSGYGDGYPSAVVPAGGSSCGGCTDCQSGAMHPVLSSTQKSWISSTSQLPLTCHACKVSEATMSSEPAKERTIEEIRKELGSIDRVIPMGDQAPILCPRCKSHMELGQIEDSMVIICEQCEGLLIQSPILAHLVDVRRKSYHDEDLIPPPMNTAQLKKKIKCPGCGTLMDVHPFHGPGNAVIDSCVRCSLTFLDAGELTSIEKAPGRR